MSRVPGLLAAALLAAAMAGCDGGGSGDAGAGGDGGVGADGDLAADGGAEDARPDGGASDAEHDGGSGDVVLLANETPCSGDSIWVVPDPGEEGHLYAARLTPESYPFVVETVRYHVVTETEAAGSAGCNAGLAHRVELYVSTETTPPAEPEPVAVIDAPAEPDLDVEHLASHSLSAPVTLAEGQHLFVAVEMAGTSGGDRLCVSACENPAAEANRDFWSGAANPPYPWATMSSLGLDAYAEIFALGRLE